MNYKNVTIFVYFMFYINNVIGDKKNGSIVIIGAGISGLGAADHLINNYGFTNVIVLEALNRIGGRIYPVPFENGMLQMGAEWVHGAKNPMFKLAEELSGLAFQSKFPRYDGSEPFMYTQNGCTLDESFVKMYTEMNEKIEDDIDEFAKGELYSGSVAQLYKERFEEYLNNNTVPNNITDNIYEAIFDFIRKNVESENGVTDWNKASHRQLSEYTPTVGGSDIPLGINGYKVILDYFASRIPREKIHFNKTVTKITYLLGNEPVMIETEDNEVYSADHVIVTSSLGYLKQNAGQMFNPPLPEDKLKTIETLGFGNLGKVFLIYNESFWDEDASSIYFLRIPNDSKTCFLKDNLNILPETNLSKIFFAIEPKPFFKNVLLCFINGEDIPLMESSSEAEVSAAATESLKRFLNNDKIPKPVQVIKSSWNSNPMFLGSYSYYSTDCDLIRCNRSTLSMPVFLSRRGSQIPVILFAGEATSDHEFQTTHGALESGRREAKRLNDFYSRLCD